MKEKIDQLETLLTKIIELIEQHKEIEQIDLKEYDTMYENVSPPFEGFENGIAAFRQTIVNFKNDNFFYNKDIPKIKELLMNALKNVNHVLSFEGKRIKNSADNGFRPNQDFISLLRMGILNTAQDIFGTFKKKTVLGHLTEDGFFELNIDGKKILCQDFASATLNAWEKISPNDGWHNWSAIDNVSGKSQPMKFFRQKLRMMQ